jgi:hypothetical protein
MKGNPNLTLPTIATPHQEVITTTIRVIGEDTDPNTMMADEANQDTEEMDLGLTIKEEVLGIREAMATEAHQVIIAMITRITGVTTKVMDMDTMDSKDPTPHTTRIDRETMDTQINTQGILKIEVDPEMTITLRQTRAREMVLSKQK